MTTLTRWSRPLVIAGLVGMVIGAVDPLEGSVVIVAGGGVAALGARFGNSRRRRLLYWAFALLAAGVAAMVVLTLVGGTGGNTGRSNWWLITALPYPVGWIMGLVGAVLSLRQAPVAVGSGVITEGP